MPSAKPTVARSSKRRRRSAPKDDVDDALDTSYPSWGSLHEDLVRLIGWRVLASDLLDYVRFRAVCPSWRSSTDCPRGRGIVDPRFHPRRWMMLPEGHGLYPGHGKLRGYVRFFNLSSGVFVRARLPIFKDHCVLDSVDGILILQRDQDTVVRLLHPFTGAIADLPQLATLLPYVPRWFIGAGDEAGKWFFLRNNISTCINVSADGVITVMMWLSNLMRMAFAISGDPQWRLSSWTFQSGRNPLSFQGKMYMVTRLSFDGEADVVQIKPTQHEMDSGTCSLPPPKPIATFPNNARCYLVECNSEILLYTSRYSLPSEIRPPPVTVYRLADLIMKRIIPVTSIGGNALFLNAKRNLSVNSKALPTLVEDTIVVSMDKPCFSQYHINTGTFSQAADGLGSTTNYFVTGPCTIINHIITCCYRDQWNKGQVVGQGKIKSSWRVKGKYRAGA